MKIKSIRTTNNILIFDGDNEACVASVKKDVDRILSKDGESIHHPDGSREFIIFDAIFNIENETYIWDKSGNRVKHNKVRHIIAKDGTHTTEIIGTSFRNF